MKRIFLFSIVLLLSGISFSFIYKGEEKVKVKWYTLEEAMKLAKDKPKKLFVDMYTDWCGWCKKMDASTFENPVIAKYLNDNYYPVKFNAEQKDSIVFNGQVFRNPNNGPRSTHEFAVAALQGRLGYPSFVIIDATKLSFTIMQGYQTPEQIEPILNYYSGDKSTTVNYNDFIGTFVSKLSAGSPSSADGNAGQPKIDTAVKSH